MRDKLERALIGKLIMRPDEIAAVRWLGNSDIHNPQSKELIETMRGMLSADVTINPISARCVIQQRSKDPSWVSSEIILSLLEAQNFVGDANSVAESIMQQPGMKTLGALAHMAVMRIDVLQDVDQEASH